MKTEDHVVFFTTAGSNAAISQSVGDEQIEVAAISDVVKDASISVEVDESLCGSSFASVDISPPTAAVKFTDVAENLFTGSGTPTNDIGYAIKINRECLYSLTDHDIHMFLTDRWKPECKEDFPGSVHNKNAQQRTRRLNNDHLLQFAWVAVSKLLGFEGA